MSVLPIQLKGDNIRNAVKWISEMRSLEPKSSIIQLIEAACREYDLSPKESDFLIRINTEKKS